MSLRGPITYGTIGTLFVLDMADGDFSGLVGWWGKGSGGSGGGGGDYAGITEGGIKEALKDFGQAAGGQTGSIEMIAAWIVIAAVAWALFDGLKAINRSLPSVAPAI